MERDQDRTREGDEAPPGDEGHGFAETLPADGAGWERALEPDEHPRNPAEEQPEPRRAP